MQQREIDVCTDVVGRGSPPTLHTQTLNYAPVPEHTAERVCKNTRWQTQRQLWGGHWGLIDDPARAPLANKIHSVAITEI